mmetsp:Transcript_37781/g.77599  ORF Transcript_37781/g.77599 Transcript_37781/m.77599 type:complete len:344 (+) Transcript_37781:1012-2043(+)
MRDLHPHGCSPQVRRRCTPASARGIQVVRATIPRRDQGEAGQRLPNARRRCEGATGARGCWDDRPGRQVGRQAVRGAGVERYNMVVRRRSDRDGVGRGGRRRIVRGGGPGGAVERAPPVPPVRRRGKRRAHDPRHDRRGGALARLRAGAGQGRGTGQHVVLRQTRAPESAVAPRRVWRHAHSRLCQLLRCTPRAAAPGRVRRAGAAQQPLQGQRARRHGVLVRQGRDHTGGPSRGHVAQMPRRPLPLAQDQLCCSTVRRVRPGNPRMLCQRARPHPRARARLRLRYSADTPPRRLRHSSADTPPRQLRDTSDSKPPRTYRRRRDSADAQRVVWRVRVQHVSRL